VRILYSLLFIFIILLCGVPLAFLASKSLFHPQLLSLLFQSSVIESLYLTLKVAGVSLIISLSFALPLSYVLARTDLWGKNYFRSLLIFPYFIPSYLFAIAWITLTLPEVGLLNKILGFTLFNCYSFWGLVGVTTNAFFPILVIPLLKNFAEMDPSLEEAGRCSGASPRMVFFKITLPCLRAPLIGCSILFLFVVLSSFGIPALLGNPAKLYVLTTKIFTVTKMGGLDGAEQGFIIALWLILFSILILWFGRFLKNRFQVSLTTGKVARFSVIRLGHWQVPVFLSLFILMIFLVFLPLGSLFFTSVSEVAGSFELNKLTFKHYRYLLHLKEAKEALLNSVSLALMAGSTCCFLGFLIVYFSHRTSVLGAVFLERLASLPFSIPGTILALGFLVTFSSSLSAPFLLFFAYLAKDLAIAIQQLGPALNQIDKSLEEAASVCGAKRSKIINLILYPLLWPHIQSVFLLCALPMLSELTMSVLLYGPQSETIGTLIFQLQDYSNPLAACALASVIVVSIALVMFIFNLTKKETTL